MDTRVLPCYKLYIPSFDQLLFKSIYTQLTKGFQSVCSTRNDLRCRNMDSYTVQLPVDCLACYAMS